MPMTALPFVDLRGKSPIDLLRSYPDVARQLIASARRSYGRAAFLASYPGFRLGDRLAHRWLSDNKNPYLHEIESFAEILEAPGVKALNLSYEFGCTSGAWRTGDTVSMLRVLDWPVMQLGRFAMVVLQSSRVGDYYNITWPATSGVYTAMAPGRFCAALNQAPSRRHGWGAAGDWVTNALHMLKETGLPPAHLLRRVFETAVSYSEAKTMLMDTPLAVPAIYTLAGTQPGEGCIIERLEHTVKVIELSAGQMVSSANHFQSDLSQAGQGFRPREIDSAGRFKLSCSLGGHDLEAQDFRFLQAPIINANTRLAMVGDAATGRLMVQGYEGSIPTTDIFNLPPQVQDYERQAV